LSEGTPAVRGHITQLVRPDRRLLVRPVGEWTAEAAAQAVAASEQQRIPSVTHVDEEAVASREALAAAGFVVSRRDAHVAFSVEQALEALGDARLPAGVSLRSAEDVDEDALRQLDDELRQDVPGTSGWRSTPEEFREHTFADPAFDPRTYLVAVDDGSGELIGLVRIWMNPQGPRLGKVGVLPEWRRRGIASALLAEALRAVRALGASEVASGHDVANEASRGLFERLGALRVSTVLELVYEPEREVSRVG
jgi:RimJ/RimL family protein N-acetyltransferase